MRAAVFAILVAASSVAFAGDARVCTNPDDVARNADGTIKRSQAARRNFVREHPCPSTGLTTGACAGWYVDHVIPLACGGCDDTINMQWLPEAQWKDKSKWERKVYCGR
jgi:uncharacterized MAPEG superfamily protein